jgi:AcrR family transcriptional regulator
MPRAQVKRWERRKDDRPGEIVAAAVRLFTARGFAATRLEDVAAAAGVSKGTVYLYFAGKEQLFEAVIREAVAPNLDRAEGLIRAARGPTPELLRGLIALLRPLLDTPLTGVVKIIIAESGNFPSLARLYADLIVRRGLGLVRSIIERGMARGEFRAVDAQATAPLIMAPFVLLALWKHSLGAHTALKLDAQVVLDAHVDTLLHGLAAAPKAAIGTATKAVAKPATKLRRRGPQERVS